MFGPNYKVDVTTHSNLEDPAYAAEATAQYLESQTGILPNGGADLIGEFVNTTMRYSKALPGWTIRLLHMTTKPLKSYRKIFSTLQLAPILTTIMPVTGRTSNISLMTPTQAINATS